MPRDEELASVKITIPYSLPFGSEIYDALWISINGLISFGYDNSSFSPKHLPVNKYSKLLAVYWSDLDLLKGDTIAEIYYQLYSKNAAKNKDILDKANLDVMTNSNELTSYDATYVLVVTWVEVPAHLSNDERVSFQCVIITDGFTTFAQYRYTNGGMKFNPALARPVVVGWGDTNFDTQISSYYVFDTVLGNTKTQSLGYWFFKVGGSENFQARCQNWYQNNIVEKTNLQSGLDRLPNCPCSELIAEFSALWNKTTQNHCYDTVANYGDFGMRCCYREGGNFENRPRLAGSFQRYNSLGKNPYGHALNDELPYFWCCQQSNLCEKYYELRPISTCNSNSFQRALLFGDPHIITLDQRSFIFNGLGEYRLLEITQLSVVNFIMQGRTCRAMFNNGSLINSATIWCALTFRTTLKDTFSIEMNKNRTSLILYVNKEDISRRLDGNYYYNKIDGMIVKKEAGILQVVTTDYISVNFIMNNQMLEFSVDLPLMYQKLTKGLLGNFNGNSGDDFIFPNGTVLSNNSRESVLFDYGNSWRVVDSIFTYSYGQNTSTYSDPLHKPLFLDENPQYVDDAAKVCNGIRNLPCIFDYIATRNIQVAQSSLNASTNQETIVKVKEDVPPSLSTPNQTFVRDNSTFTISVPGQSSRDQNVTCQKISGSNYTVSTVNGSSCRVQGTIYSPQLEVIAISTVSQTGLQSMVVQIPLTLCTCQNKGICDYNNTRKTSNGVYLLASCNCSAAYAGLSCELDKDGCASSPCQTNCTDISADTESNTGIAYQCGNCLRGYTLNENKTKCQDINECDMNPCGSNSKCMNTLGSYICQCFDGFRWSEKNRNLCVDINECTESINNCVQICLNTQGSYRCDCVSGYELVQPEGLPRPFNCTQIKAPENPCVNATCEQECQNVQNQAVCFCRSGFRLKSDRKSCEDINECVEGLCSQGCNNTVGSYSCSCFAGYKLTASQSCEECPGATYGINCGKTCSCRGRASGCDKVKGCVCRSNWRGVSCEVDVDECVEGLANCRPDQICQNTMGSFACNCPPGFVEINGTCTNIDECKNATLNLCQQICVDTLGSYVCQCQNGYTKVNNNCADIDECALHTSDCEQLCINNVGSYSCACKDGYTLKDDRKSCFDDLLLCTNTYINCSHGCTLENKTAVCFCNKGYRLASNMMDCIDINECQTEVINCYNNATCTNLPGTYSCTCPDGFKLQNDRRTCQPCDAYHWGTDCAEECNCFPIGTQSCDPIQGCICRPGWAGTTCHTDKNECSFDITYCPENSDCINTLGSFYCQCRRGYTYSNSACTDVDECLKFPPCDQVCVNTPGSYTCSCSKGFFVDGDRCRDFNECNVRELNNCDQTCRNTFGGFACECFDGYVLNTTSWNTCYLENVTKACKNSSQCEHYCVPSDSGDMCQCKPGYRLAGDNSTCEDINECVGSDSVCINGTCQNMNGSFACSCNDSFRLLIDGKTCQACDAWTYGKNCSGVCTCDRDNSLRCDPLNGLCTCIPGWNGDNCTLDVDECSETNQCLSNMSTCLNTPGSYKCLCNLGFYSASDFSCISCDNWYYGQNCDSQCVCESDNTMDCDAVTGQCHCKPGWNDTKCDKDINECLNASYCLGNHLQCHNLNGSAECRCTPGYERKLNETACTDVDECYNPVLNSCNNRTEDCKNTDGSFFCVCKAGYKLEDIRNCVANYKDYSLTLRLDYPNDLITNDVLDTNKKDFFVLAKEVEKTLVSMYNGTKSAFLPPRVLQFINGSLIADVLLRFDLNYSTNPTNDVAMYVHIIQSAKQFTVGNVTVAILDIAVNNQPVPDSNNYCDLYEVLKKSCPDKESCPEVRAASPCEEDGVNKDLIIGLSVGIPLAVALLVSIIIISCVYVRRRKHLPADQASTSSNGSGFSVNMVPRRTGPAPPLYSPVYKSESQFDIDKDYLEIPGNKQEMQRLSWVETESSSAAHVGSEEYSDVLEPDFSWENIQPQLEDTKDFHIQRPVFCGPKQGVS
ncbi:uncharacterized protein LOC106054924 [Biomphalaria glabrata]|uniref:Uncharacterized protein LOC106054924 n=1 Tax=Biomphalaria glabrata TaxID=6526 RepID=A0A9W2Y9V9_BIOGL|nr:uncharacterized protein LOC106054924 [Biomphalaria glabrata]